MLWLGTAGARFPRWPGLGCGRPRGTATGPSRLEDGLEPRAHGARGGGLEGNGELLTR